MSLDKNKPTIAIDIDDVLAVSAIRWINYSNDCWGTNLTIDDFDENFPKMWQVNTEEAQRRCDDFLGTGIMSSYEDVPISFSVLKRLKDNYNLLIVTARRLQMKDTTTIWLKEKFPEIFDGSHIHYAGIWDKVDDNSHHRTKAEIFKNLNVDFVIDDQVKHCIGASELGVKALLFGDYAWNKVDDLPETISRVNDWAEVEKYFNEFTKN